MTIRKSVIVNRKTMPNMYARGEQLPGGSARSGPVILFLLILAWVFFILYLAIGNRVRSEGPEVLPGILTSSGFIRICIIYVLPVLFLLCLSILYFIRHPKTIEKAWESFSDEELRALDEECKDAPAMERALLTNQVILLRTGPDFEPVRVKNIVSICLVEGDPYDDIHITDNEGKEYNIDSLSVTKDRQADDYLRFLEDLYGNTHPKIRFYKIDRNKRESPVARLRLWDYPLIFEVAAQSELLPCADAVLGILRREVAAGNMIIKVWNATHASFARHVMIRLRLGESTDYDGLTYDKNGYRIWSSQERKHRVTIVFGDRTDDYAEYFCDLAREQAGLDFRLVRIIPRQKSIIVNRERIRIPVLGMLTLGDTYEKMIHGTKNASVSPSRSAELLPLWKKTAAHFWNNEMSEYYDSDMDLFVKRYEDICYMSFAYDQKRMVKDYLRERLPIPMHEVFASSAPGLHIVYGRAEYEKMRIDELQEELREEIREMARKYVASVYGFPMECDFSVTFWHPEMENYNGYGLARQD